MKSFSSNINYFSLGTTAFSNNPLIDQLEGQEQLLYRNYSEDNLLNNLKSCDDKNELDSLLGNKSFLLDNENEQNANFGIKGNKDNLEVQENKSVNNSNNIIIQNNNIHQKKPKQIKLAKIYKNKNKKTGVHRKDNPRKKVIKIPFNNVKRIIEKKMNLKLDVNLEKLVFGSNFDQNRAALHLKIYEILFMNPKNKNIIEEAQFDNIVDEKIAYYLLTRNLEFIFEQYINNNKTFLIGEELFIINEFQTLKDELEPGSELENILKNYFQNLKDGIFDKKGPKINVKRKIFFIVRKIKKLEEFLKKIDV